MVKRFFILLSSISTLIISLLFVDSLKEIWIIPVAFVASKIIFVAMFAIYLYIYTLFIKEGKDYPFTKYHHKLFVFCGTLVCDFCRAKIKVQGLEKVPKNTRFLFVQNHRSNLDPVIAFCALKKTPTSIISKPRNFKIIYLGKMMIKQEFIPINRENPREGIKAINKAIEHIKTDKYSVIVYPEGTRNKYDNNLLPFKGGSFKIAQKTNVPIVISSITGTENLKHYNPFKRVKILVKILEVIHPKDFASTAEMASYAEKTIANDLGVKVYTEEEAEQLFLAHKKPEEKTANDIAVTPTETQVPTNTNSPAETKTTEIKTPTETKETAQDENINIQTETNNSTDTTDTKNN